MSTNKTAQLKTPITYYGGKQQMLKDILPLIPEHEIYVEPYVGGGALFWAKEPSESEIINDLNGAVVNFYRVLKGNFTELKKKIDGTLHSRLMYKSAKVIYDCPWLFDSVTRAWAFWIVSQQGFAGKIGSWGYGRKQIGQRTSTKIAKFTEAFAERLKSVQIEHNEAHTVIQSRDSKETFVYADPPYISSNQGHYKGYTEDDFRRDLDVLATMQGKFLLSSYPSEILDEYIQKYGWYSISKEKKLSATRADLRKGKTKREVLTANYPIG